MKNIKISLIIIAILFAGTTAFAQKKGGSTNNEWGIGIRLGDPSGLTVKKYFGNNSLEFSLGRSHTWYNDRYYDDYYHDYYDDYKDYKVISDPIGFQCHYLFQKPINRIGDQRVGGLDWYYGFGGQLITQSYYIYYDNDTREKFTDLDLGADGVIGLEYRFKNSPISMFLDLTLMMEIFDDPFYFWTNGGIGVRYNF
ncbi:TPA: hypothetical protein DCR49_06495 [Candidatus Delongbacteria bacterium]|nr:hypothetical protein [Candidatus Delongbacteria bacterium]